MIRECYSQLPEKFDNVDGKGENYDIGLSTGCCEDHYWDRMSV